MSNEQKIADVNQKIAKAAQTIYGIRLAAGLCARAIRNFLIAGGILIESVDCNILHEQLIKAGYKKYDFAGGSKSISIVSNNNLKNGDIVYFEPGVGKAGSAVFKYGHVCVVVINDDNIYFISDGKQNYEFFPNNGFNSLEGNKKIKVFKLEDVSNVKDPETLKHHTKELVGNIDQNESGRGGIPEEKIKKDIKNMFKNHMGRVYNLENFKEIGAESLGSGIGQTIANIDNFEDISQFALELSKSVGKSFLFRLGCQNVDAFATFVNEAFLDSKCPEIPGAATFLTLTSISYQLFIICCVSNDENRTRMIIDCVTENLLVYGISVAMSKVIPIPVLGSMIGSFCGQTIMNHLNGWKLISKCKSMREIHEKEFIVQKQKFNDMDAEKKRRFREFWKENYE